MSVNHRVLAAGGKVGGFSAPGGSAAKIMLTLEGIHLEQPAPAQQSFGCSEPGNQVAPRSDRAA